MRRVPSTDRAGFTLVELMMVIAIIGILAGLVVPAVMRAFSGASGRAIAMEAQSLAQSIEAYKNKTGDYPPDGSSAAVFERHFRKRFPQILASEFTNLNKAAGRSSGAAATTPPQVMDPAEALVFALGGFSTDPTKPFTGPGGPIDLSGASPQYNVDRNEPLYDFNQAYLTLDTSSGWHCRPTKRCTVPAARPTRCLHIIPKVATRRSYTLTVALTRSTLAPVHTSTATARRQSVMRGLTAVMT